MRQIVPSGTEMPAREGAASGTSPTFLRLMNLVDQIAGRSETVLLIGESGTSKELLARTIHERSLRRAHPFVTAHCGGNPEMMFGARQRPVARAFGRRLVAKEKRERRHTDQEWRSYEDGESD